MSSAVHEICWAHMRGECCGVLGCSGEEWIGELFEWRGEGCMGEELWSGEGCSLVKGEKALYCELWKLGVSAASMQIEGL